MERMFWGLLGLGVSLVIFFAVLHILKNQGASIPVVGGPVSQGASWVGTHSTNY